METQQPFLNKPVRPRPAEKAKRVVRGFNEFIKQYGVVPLAIAVVIGNAANDLVKSVVDGLITPLVALLSPQTRLQNFQIEVGQSVFKVGQVFSALLSFLIVAWVVYVIVKLVLRSDASLEKK